MRYIIGIDLGTTNCCVSYVDTHASLCAIVPFFIPQIVSSNRVDRRATLPSFCYLTTPGEWPVEALRLPWKSREDAFVGYFARSHGARVPTRLIQSAKSWLCLASPSRREKILPFESRDHRMSPVEATSRYLSHIKEAWNDQIAKGNSEEEFEVQEIILTVPASFDESARALTIEAARMAGYKTMTLLEEPQAAFYSWLSQNEKTNVLFPGAVILVCDVGGGTTDFSLIHVISPEGKFERMAVGNHLLLGGDNMDAALAHRFESKLAQHESLTDGQWLQLKHETRVAKETLLSSEEQRYQIVLQGSGSSVVRGVRSLEVLKEEVEATLLDGFFRHCSFEEALCLQKSAAIRTMGLPYEAEPSIVKHLAHFLQKASPKIQKPDFVLFNGGVMKPPIFQEAILKSLSLWFPEKQPGALTPYHLDLAVARGAAYYGKARRGMGIKIAGGSPRAYYLVVDAKDISGKLEKKALTLLPRGYEEGDEIELEETFLLKANSPVSFQICCSNVRLEDKKSQLIPLDDQEMLLLPPIQTILRLGKQKESKIPVRLKVKATELGTLEMILKSLETSHTWGLEFQVRNAEGQENSLIACEEARPDQTFDDSLLRKIEDRINSIYLSSEKPTKIGEHLEILIGMSKIEWPLSILRTISDALIKQATHRKKTLEHELRWWNLLGFAMRPGIGYPLDDFRMKEIWKIILEEAKALKTPDGLIQAYIFYRRIASGLKKGQQIQLASELMTTLPIKKKQEEYSFSEKVRALASFELIDNSMKIKVGNVLMDRIRAGERTKFLFWSLARIGARQLVHGNLSNVLPKEICSEWVKELMIMQNIAEEDRIFLFEQLARKTKHREVNLPEPLIHDILKHFENEKQYEKFSKVLLEENMWTQHEQELAFGEQLPPGLTLERPV